MMTKNISVWLRGAVMAGVFTALTASAAVLGSTRVSIPFEFELDGKMLPAGKYEFRPGDLNQTMSVDGPAGRMIVATMPVGNPNEARGSHLVFDQNGPNRRLRTVWLKGVPVGRDLAAQKTAKAGSAAVSVN